MKLELSTFLLQWSAGGLLAGWVTTRHRLVGLGYGWLLRTSYGLIAVLATVVGWRRSGGAARTEMAFAAATAAAAAVALAVSVARRRTGVSGGRARRAARVERVATMTGRHPDGGQPTPPGREYPPVLDLLAAAIGLVGLVPAAAADGGPYALTLARLLVGAVFLGAVSDAMLLGHWYLVQPGLGRDPIRELVKLVALAWPIEVALLLVPTGMVQAFSGEIDDGYGGLLAWVWLVSAVTTIGLVGVTWLALRERRYSAVMAATGLLYLAILTAFGTDLVARAVLA